MHRNLLLTLAGDLVHPSWINISDPILIRTNEFSIFFIQHNNQREILGLQAKSIRCTGHRIFATITNIETNFAFNSLTKIWLRRPLNPSRSNCFTMPRFGEWSCNLGTDVGINSMPIGAFPINTDFHISGLVTFIFSCMRYLENWIFYPNSKSDLYCSLVVWNLNSSWKYQCLMFISFKTKIGK